MLAIKKCVEFLSQIDLAGHNDELGALIEKLQAELVLNGSFSEKIVVVLCEDGDRLGIFSEKESNIEIVAIDDEEPDEDDSADQLFGDGENPRDLKSSGKQIWWG